jgi:cyclase
MLQSRIIPALLISHGDLVKTTKFKDPKYVGDPLNAIRIFNEKEVDELMLIDISASKEGREPDYELIEQVAGECFMPLAYGGGISNIEQAKRIFSLGVEKICLQSAVLENPNLITKFASYFGSQSIMVSIDIKKDWLGQAHIYSYSNGRCLKSPWIEYSKKLVCAGAGEILLNAVDKDGTLGGPDLKIIRELSDSIDIPLIALGGVSSLSDIKSVIDAGASAVAAGAMFIYHGPHRAVLINYPKSSELKKILNYE